jgi:XTP/dITP diphosphohydrolase
MKKISKLLIGTNNKGKYKEIKDLLPKYIKTYSTSEFKLKSPKEDGLTFEENSIIKSKHFSKKTKLICLADDSGLEIDILDKSPGIYSARWGGKKGDFKKAINRVYKELSKKDKNWKNKKIKARFICALSICYLDKKIASVLGKVEGYISPKSKGKNGFGYDPIFIPTNRRKTFGEMSSIQKV